MFVLITDPYREKSNPLKSVIEYGALDKYFLVPDLLLRLTRKGYAIKYEGDASRKGVDCFVIKIYISDTEEYFKQYKTIYISKEKYLPVSAIHRVEYKNGTFQYSEHNFFNFKAHVYTGNTPFLLPLSKGLRIILSENIKKQWSTEPLPVNSIAPLLTGRLFPLNTRKSLADYKGKLTLLDFFGICYAGLVCGDPLNRLIV